MAGKNYERSEIMRKKLTSFIFLLSLLLLVFGVTPSGAGVYVQCPLVNADGTIKTDGGSNPIAAMDSVTGTLISTVAYDNANTVCIHLIATDGFVNMADKATVDPPNGRLQYIFGFTNVTGITDTATSLPIWTRDAILDTVALGAEFSAPTISIKQGQNVYLTLTNRAFVIRPDLFDSHSVHFHGFPNAASVFDGEPMASTAVNPGSSFTYYYKVPEPGTYMYHCHVEASEHMQMGMLGNLFVRPLQDDTPPGCGGRVFAGFAYNDGDCTTGYDVMYPLQMVSFDPRFHDADQNIQPLPFANMTDYYTMLNGRGYPDTINPNRLNNTFTDLPSGGKPSQKINSIITATKGQKILFRISSLSTVDYYTLVSPGIPMRIVGKDTRLLRTSFPPFTNLYYDTNSVTLGGGMSVDAILDTTNIAPGTYFFYTSNVTHLNNDQEDFGGMMTEINILAPGVLRQGAGKGRNL
jgi:FtsP/CotA-like multicopper oxidase with cupredoxin domain